ncbi:MAG: hypothetical protein JW836_03175 [Deltaproteobacteria bacterium]|nr:hypothetical protein [Deltaproteobacteria bacterium]
MAKKQDNTAERPELELVECTRQPGKLRLSQYACGRRYLRAQDSLEEIPENDFGITLRWSLQLCRNCPQGLSRSKNIKLESTPQPLRRGKRIRFGKKKKTLIPFQCTGKDGG